MPRRNLKIIANYQDAVEWLEEFRCTVNDDQVLKVIEQFEKKIGLKK